MNEAMVQVACLKCTCMTLNCSHGFFEMGKWISFLCLFSWVTQKKLFILFLKISWMHMNSLTFSSGQAIIQVVRLECTYLAQNLSHGFLKWENRFLLFVNHILHAFSSYIFYIYKIFLGLQLVPVLRYILFLKWGL